MHTGPQYTGTQPPRGGSGGGRGSALLIGGAAFALVFLLIVGGTVAYLVLRPSGGGGSGAETASATTSASTTPSETPTDVVEERCYQPDLDRISSNPSGKLRGGGLQFIPAAAYDGRDSGGYAFFLNDTQVAYGEVEEDWVSTATVGLVEWQPGIEYPGNEVASQKIAKCFFTNGNWSDHTSHRTWDEEATTPVTIAGLPGYMTRGVVNFGTDTLETTDASEIVVVVLETEQGPSALAMETAVGVPEFEEASDAALESLTGLGS